MGQGFTVAPVTGTKGRHPMKLPSLPLWSFLVAVLALAVWPVSVLAQDTGTGSSTSIDALSNFALWSIIGGALTSVVTAVINRSNWSSDAKLGVFFGLCCIVAAGNAYFNRTLGIDDWLRSLLLVVASGWLTYQAAKPAIKTIEAKTG